eukprot:3366137-Lingulodinium_polyedra.AAC.1
MAGRMNKEQCIEELRRLGEEVPKTWTLPEIRGYLTQKWQEAGQPRAVQKEGSSYMHLKKGELENLCDERDIPVTKGDNRDSLIFKLMQNDRLMQPTTGTDYLGFGKFGNRTYEEVRDQEPSYCRW